ncbi:unnamed protein product [Arctia plantaginis]|uniref:Uncharacterized protein n=1 Tax=Arctia plantaginis TaxID=874455 RepID=A0A8S0ZRP2_ARCPL|nr:unnamed protein product [Arctia plantaginis]
MPFAKDVQAQFNIESSSFFMSVGLEVSARTGWKPAQDSIAKCSALAPQVTSRAYCWLVAFADVSSEYLDIPYTLLQNSCSVLERNVLRSPLSTATISSIQNIERVLCDRWRSLSAARGVLRGGEGGVRQRGTPPPTSVSAVTLCWEDVSLPDSEKDRSRANFEH